MFMIVKRFVWLLVTTITFALPSVVGDRSREWERTWRLGHI